jgi:hypothetical protein
MQATTLKEFLFQCHAVPIKTPLTQHTQNHKCRLILRSCSLGPIRRPRNQGQALIAIARKAIRTRTARGMIGEPPCLRSTLRTRLQCTGRSSLLRARQQRASFGGMLNPLGHCLLARPPWAQRTQQKPPAPATIQSQVLMRKRKLRAHSRPQPRHWGHLRRPL